MSICRFNFHFLWQVDEGIEAMLCCWLQQLQEFGGPEVDKPDLLKGSIGSLKNLGLANASSVASTTTTSAAPAVTATATTTTTNIKANSTPGSIIKQNPCLDKRARYNVSITFKSHSNSHCVHHLLWRTFCAAVAIVVCCCHYICTNIYLFC